MADAAAPMEAAGRASFASRLLLLLGVALVLFPSLRALVEQSWSSEAGMHGPITLATALWLIARRRKEITAIARPGSIPVVIAGLAFVVPSYIFGRAFDFLSIEASALLGMLTIAAYAHYGGAVLRKMWFVILYLGFLIPLPGWVIDELTAPLKTFASWAATGTLQALGYPILREGVTLWIMQYQLLVEDACAGLNSLMSLTAISLFYIYILHNASWRYALFLVLWIIPVAIFANIVRIIALVLVTYYFGDAAAQGFLHSTAGIVMFVVAVLGIFIIDSMIQRVARFRRRAA